MAKKGKKFGLKWEIFGLYLKKDHQKKFGVPGNIIYKKSPVNNNINSTHTYSQPESARFDNCFAKQTNKLRT